MHILLKALCAFTVVTSFNIQASSEKAQARQAEQSDEAKAQQKYSMQRDANRTKKLKHYLKAAHLIYGAQNIDPKAKIQLTKLLLDEASHVMATGDDSSDEEAQE